MLNNGHNKNMEIQNTEFWQKYSSYSYLFNVVLVLTGILVWRTYKKVQNNAANWKTFAQRHGMEHVDSSVYGTVKGTVDGMEFIMSQEMSEKWDSMASDSAKRRYDHNNHSIERMSFSLPAAPATMKIYSSKAPQVAMMAKLSEMKGEQPEPHFLTGESQFDQAFTVICSVEEQSLVKEWLTTSRQQAMLNYSGAHPFTLLTRKLAVQPADGMGNLEKIERQYQSLLALAKSL